MIRLRGGGRLLLWRGVLLINAGFKGRYRSATAALEPRLAELRDR